jgi:hypothetical protein
MPDRIFEGGRVANIIRTIPEPNKTVDVVRECNVLVLGGSNILEFIIFGRIADEQVAAERPWSS